uniref:Uncharacterized protein n=1 Tax=Romanomermis culicivorax TaxID=13658 RepID=A0A915I4S0_ROMCU
MGTAAVATGDAGCAVGATFFLFVALIESLPTNKIVSPSQVRIFTTTQKPLNRERQDKPEDEREITYGALFEGFVSVL